MRSDLTTKLAMIAVAGLACSTALAQKQASKVVSKAVGASEGAAALPQRTPIAAKRVVRLNYNGAADASDVLVYNNGDFAVLPVDGYFSFANTSRVQEDAGLNASPGGGAGPGTTVVSRSIKSVTVAIATTATPNPTDTPDVAFNWYNTYTPGAGVGVPIAGALAGGFRITLPAPIGLGWEADTLYLFDVDVSAAPFTILNDLGTAEVAIYSGTTGTTPNTNFNVGMYGDGNTVGNSQNTFYYDQSLDGIIAQNEAFIGTSNPTNGLRPHTSMVLSLTSNLESGACCLPNGTCILSNATNCTRNGGAYAGDSTTCTAACTQPGACVLADGSCISAASGQCTTLGGTYKGNGTNCANAVCSGPSILFNNGPLSTGGLSAGGVASPAGSTWCEATGVAACNNTINGFSSGVAGTTPFRLADDFTVPAGETWTITSVDTFAYQTGATPASSPFTGGNFNLQIWDGPPGTIGTSVVVYGDETTNRLTSSTFSNMYKIFYNQAGTTRPIWKNTLTLSPPAVLTAGTYYLDWQTGTPAFAAHFSPPVTTKGLRATPGRNALQRVPVTVGLSNDWQIAEETGSVVNCGVGIATAEFPFVLNGSKTGAGPGCGPAPCYANCDASTSNPLLTANDFQCFLNAYASNLAYANCDGSTNNPVLTANDFQCFLNAYAAGCS